jgi:CubicO group peptidase (beta-lactamase class C family)
VELPSSFRGAVLVAKGSRVLLEGYAGLADASAGIASDATTRFQISSVSKQFVAACVLLLAHEGSLSVGDPVSQWFPRSPRSWDAISIGNLLTHTAGLGHWDDYADLDPGQPITDDAFVAAVQARPLPAVLPAEHTYSSPSYGLLVRIVEEASGTMYTRFVTEKIFNPLRMRDTFVGSAHRRTAIARGYREDEEVPSWELDTAARGTGDVWTTARDLDRWDQALFSDAVLPIEARDAMFRSYTPIEGPPNVHGYGYGLLIGAIHDQPLYMHPGDNPGYASFNAIVPSMKVRVIVLSNDESYDIFTPAMNYLETALSS